MSAAATPGPGAVPLAGLLATWGTAFLQGRVSADDLITAVGGDQPQRVAGLDDDPTPLGVAVALATLRRAGASALRPVLPVPGDVLGVPGPASFVRAATAAGQAVLTVGPPWWGLVPEEPEGEAGPVVWRALRVDPQIGPAGLPSLAEADRALAEALRESTAAMAGLDLAGGRDEVETDLARAWRRVPRAALPEVLPARAIALLDRATRVTAILAVADRHQGAAVTAAEAAARRAALRPLATAARHAVVAAFAAPAEPS